MLIRIDEIIRIGGSYFLMTVSAHMPIIFHLHIRHPITAGTVN